MNNPSRFVASHRPSFIKQHARRCLSAATAALVLLATVASAQTPAAASKPLDQSFPEKVGAFPRSAMKKTSASAAEATDSAEAKYTAPSGEIVWTATAFPAPEKALAALESMIASLTKGGGKIASNINNAEGKVRFAVLQTAQGPTYCWVNKKEKTLLYVVTGKAPDVSKFVELQTTW